MKRSFVFDEKFKNKNVIFDYVGQIQKFEIIPTKQSSVSEPDNQNSMNEITVSYNSTVVHLFQGNESLIESYLDFNNDLVSNILKEDNSDFAIPRFEINFRNYSFSRANLKFEFYFNKCPLGYAFIDQFCFPKLNFKFVYFNENTFNFSGNGI